MKAKMNILLITTDEERYRLPAAQGYSLPARDRLGSSGVTFSRYYTASAMCSSARSVIYTGQHLPITQIYDNDNMPYVQKLDPGLGTLGSMLRAAGYYCTYQGKWHLSNQYVDPAKPVSTVDALEPYGFSEWNDWGDIDGGAWAGLRVDPMITGQAAKWLRDRAPVVSANQPWFMVVSFVNPHDIMSFDYGSAGSVQPPPGLAHALVVKPPAEIPIYQRQWDCEPPDSLYDDLSGAAPAVREYAGMLDIAFGPVTDDEKWRAGMSFYLNCVRDVDRNVDAVLDALAASGQGDRTIVIFTSDHGEMAGGHGLRQKGNLVYDENFHVPLIVSHPDFRGGTTTPALASAIDLAPTLLTFAGIDADVVQERYPDLHGTTLAPALEGVAVRGGVLTAVESLTTLDASFWSNFADPDVGQRLLAGELRPDWTKRGFLRGYTDERFTFGRYFSPLGPNRPADVGDLFAGNDVVLYDRQTDPAEMSNLALDPDRRELVAQYSTKLEELISKEIGADTRAWVTERPKLLALPTWHGDTAA